MPNEREISANEANSNVEVDDGLSQLNALKAQRDTILSEKKKISDKNYKLQSVLDSIGGEEGIQSLMQLKEKMDNDNQKDLISQGKIEELLNQTTAQLKAQYENKITSIQSDLDSKKSAADLYRTKYQEKLVSDRVLDTSKRLDLADTAYKDITLHILRNFEFDENDDPVIIENGIKKINTKGEVYGIADFINDNRNDFKHWNKPSVQGFSRGSTSVASGEVDYSVMSKEQIMKDRMSRRRR